MAAPPTFDAGGLLTLRQIRAFIRGSNARGGVVFFGLLYVLGSLFLGGMVALGDVRGGYTVLTVWSGTAGAWNYPGLLVVAPWGVVSLPFFATVAMIVVGVGVGYGMTVALLLAVRLLRPSSRPANGSAAASAFAGLTPAMISLVTLGACCSTTAAATAGVGLVAQASGTSASTLLLNDWYLGVFQIGMVWVALLAQEMLLVIYAGLYEPSAVPARTPSTDVTSGAGASLVRGVFRGLLLGAGLIWALAVLAEWTTVDPATAGAGYWFQWLVQHELVAGLAIGAALFPTATAALLLRSRGAAGWILSGAVGIAGLSLLLWVPPPLPSWGVDGLMNQVLGNLGAPVSWGALDPGPISGVGLYLRWVFEYILLGGFATVCAFTPRRAFAGLAGAEAIPPRERGWQPRPSSDTRGTVLGAEALNPNVPFSEPP